MTNNRQPHWTFIKKTKGSHWWFSEETHLFVSCDVLKANYLESAPNSSKCLLGFGWSLWGRNAKELKRCIYSRGLESPIILVWNSKVCSRKTETVKREKILSTITTVLYFSLFKITRHRKNHYKAYTHTGRITNVNTAKCDREIVIYIYNSYKVSIK